MNDYTQAVTDSYVPGDALAAIMDAESTPETADAVRELEERWMGEAETLEAWAEDYLVDAGTFVGLDDTLRHYFDYSSWVRDAVLSGDIITVRTAFGWGVFHN